MSTSKRRVKLDYDNVLDYFPLGDLKVLVGRLKVGAGRIAPSGPAVGTFFTWLNARNAETADTEYTCTPVEAALILEHVGGFRQDRWGPRVTSPPAAPAPRSAGC
jgi:hypothetical protein